MHRDLSESSRNSTTHGALTRSKRPRVFRVEGKGYQVFFRAVTNKLRSHGVECTPDGVHSDGTSTFEV